VNLLSFPKDAAVKLACLAFLADLKGQAAWLW